VYPIKESEASPNMFYSFMFTYVHLMEAWVNKHPRWCQRHQDVESVSNCRLGYSWKSINWLKQ